MEITWTFKLNDFPVNVILFKNVTIDFLSPQTCHKKFGTIMTSEGTLLKRHRQYRDKFKSSIVIEVEMR